MRRWGGEEGILEEEPASTCVVLACTRLSPSSSSFIPFPFSISISITYLHLHTTIQSTARINHRSTRRITQDHAGSRRML